MDPQELCRKLEYHRREQDAARRRREKRHELRVAGSLSRIDSEEGKSAAPTQAQDAMVKPAPFIPRTAAKQFAATTTPLQDDKTKITRKPSTKQPSHKLDWTADDNPAGNPKQIFAAKAQGLSETEAAANPQQQYIPGDAAKRNRAKRNSNLYQPERAPSNAKARAAKNGSMTTWEVQDIPSYRKSLDDVPEFRKKRDAENEMPYLLPMPDDDEDRDSSLATHRPRLNPADRHDWSQRSQCGDDARHLLNLPLMRKKDRAQAAHADAQDASKPSMPAAGGLNATARPKYLRQKSQGDLPEKLIADAVKLIKQEEKARRRDSLLGLFKRQ